MARRLITLLGMLLLGSVALGYVWSSQDKVLYETKSAYNTILVTEDEDGFRTLRFERYGARQSVVKMGDPDHLELPYTKAMLISLVLARAPQRILIVGLGGGTIPVFLHKHYPQITIDAVEIDPGVVDVARRFFEFRDDATLRAHVADGRQYIEDCREPYDIIMLDAFGADNVPYDLATREFLRAVRRVVKPGGLVVGNIWSRGSNQLYDSMVRTYQDVFDELYIVDVRGVGNKILLALPQRRAVSREQLVRQASAVSRDKGFRFDLGEVVKDGFREPGNDGARAPVLLDRDKQRRAG